MSAAQGAQPPGSFTATIHESVPGGENRTRAQLPSREDEGYIQVDKKQDKVKGAAGEGGPILYSVLARKRVNPTSASPARLPTQAEQQAQPCRFLDSILVWFLRVCHEIVDGDIS